MNRFSLLLFLSFWLLLLLLLLLIGYWANRTTENKTDVL